MNISYLLTLFLTFMLLLWQCQLIIEPFNTNNIDMMLQVSCHMDLSVRYLFNYYSLSFVSILIIKYSDYKNKEKAENIHMLLCLECEFLSKSYLLLLRTPKSVGCLASLD